MGNKAPLDDAALEKGRENTANFDPAAGAPGSFPSEQRDDASKKTVTLEEQGFGVPEKYGDNKITLMVRDPWTVFSFWEIREEAERSVRQEIQRRGLTATSLILRVYDITGYGGEGDLRIAADFNVGQWSDRWYVHGGPGREWMADIGILCSNGEFFRIARSNVVRTPSNSMSDVVDEEWMCPEDLYYKLFAAAGGHGIGRSSLEVSELMERHLRKWLSSGGVVSAMFGSASFFLHNKKG
ncbi:MAG: DUF4912 domain-containing protein [Candidatus Omnitrophica bacterium]|nr:DUF4912 domain-containing protein [Candidatus Omnitrophota bacterium]